MRQRLSKPKSRDSLARARREQPRTAQSIIYKVGLLAKLLDRRSTPWFLARFGLTLAEWRLLTHLYPIASATTKSLADRLHVDKAEVSRACASLVERNYALRHPDPRDGRSALFEITAKGRKLHDRVIPFRRAEQEELRRCLAAAEFVSFNTALDKLLAHLLRSAPLQDHKAAGSGTKKSAKAKRA